MAETSGACGKVVADPSLSPVPSPCPSPSLFPVAAAAGTRRRLEAGLGEGLKGAPELGRAGRAGGACHALGARAGGGEVGRPGAGEPWVAVGHGGVAAAEVGAMVAPAPETQSERRRTPEADSGAAGSEGRAAAAGEERVHPRTG